MLNLKKEFHRIEKIFKYLKLDEIEELGIMTFLGHDAIFVKGSKDNYIVNVTDMKKVDADYTKYKVARIKSLEFFAENGVHALFPIKFNDKYFISYRNKEYEVYRYRNIKHITLKEINDKKLKRIATEQAIMHNLNIKIGTPTTYTEIKLPTNTRLERLKKYSPEGYKLLYDYYYQIIDIVKNYNNKYKYAINNSVIGYENYNLENIEWIDDYMYLVDYNNCALINPSVSLAESAYYFAKVDNKIDYETYEKYLKYYVKKYGPATYDYKEALYVSMYKPLKRLEEAIKASLKEKEDLSEDILKALKEIIIINSNLGKLYNAYLNVVKKESN